MTKARHCRREYAGMCYVRTGAFSSTTIDTGARLTFAVVQVHVGHDELVGEVIRIENDKATIQVYEETGRSSLCYGWSDAC